MRGDLQERETTALSAKYMLRSSVLSASASHRSLSTLPLVLRSLKPSPILELGFCRLGYRSGIGFEHWLRNFSVEARHSTGLAAFGWKAEMPRSKAAMTSQSMSQSAPAMQNGEYKTLNPAPLILQAILPILDFV